MSDDIEAIIAKIQEVDRASLDFAIDGMVIKVNDPAARVAIGYTDKFPKWAIAYKFEAEETTTLLKDVAWQVGRTGKLTPLALLEPVELCGATVKRATLNNYGDICRKDVTIGSRVFVRRSNDVIPEIFGRCRNGRQCAKNRKTYDLPLLRSRTHRGRRKPVLSKLLRLPRAGRGARRAFLRQGLHGHRWREHKDGGTALRYFGRAFGGEFVRFDCGRPKKN